MPVLKNLNPQETLGLTMHMRKGSKESTNVGAICCVFFKMASQPSGNLTVPLVWINILTRKTFDSSLLSPWGLVVLHPQASSVTTSKIETTQRTLQRDLQIHFYLLLCSGLEKEVRSNFQRQLSLLQLTLLWLLSYLRCLNCIRRLQTFQRHSRR